MAVTASLRRVAASTRVPVFAAVGGGARWQVDGLRLDRRLEFVVSPRHATVLLAAGSFPPALLDPLRRVHDQLSHPRTTIWWTGDGALEGTTALPDAVVAGPAHDVAELAVALQRDLLTGTRASDRYVLPDEPASPWRGVGPHGQGGEGMMGGKPYGRPMPMTGEDRDGLALDRLPLRVGPFHPAFPPGLVLDLVIQGDVIEEVAAVSAPFDASAGAPAGTAVGRSPDSVFVAALSEPLPLSTLERARARSHLTWLAGFLRVHGLAALAQRTLTVATRPDLDVPHVDKLARWLERPGTLTGATRRIATLAETELPEAVAGPVARAAGRAVDARTGDPAYRRIGFSPVTERRGDAEARWRQRLAEARQALDLARRAAAAEVMRDPGPAVEGCRRPLHLGDASDPDPLLPLVPALLCGCEWGVAMTALTSLDLDLEPVAQVEKTTPG